MDLRGKLALVTGGSAGIGREIALRVRGHSTLLRRTPSPTNESMAVGSYEQTLFPGGPPTVVGNGWGRQLSAMF